MSKRQLIRLFFHILAILSISMITAMASHASAIYPVYDFSNEKLQVSIEISNVNSLAGIKLSISYDVKQLQFMEAKKSQQVSSLMHIVNDKQPGKLIIVMAGAKGITGKTIKLIDLLYRNISKPHILPKIQIDSVQLMSDNLKDIPVKIQGSPSSQ